MAVKRSSCKGGAALARHMALPKIKQIAKVTTAVVLAAIAITVYLAIHDPKLLERRMNVGPRAEKEPGQKIIMVFAMFGFIAMLVFPVLDHRFGWSSVPAFVSALGDALIALGFLFVFVVFRETATAPPRFRLPKAKR
jgi:protein-S-isoprenylcysteine O-methyltransferase Ste14